MSDRPSVAAIVVSFHTGPRLKECLHALISDPEIDTMIVVDNGNPPDARDWLSDFSSARDDIRIVDPRENLGFGRACNVAAERAEEDLLLFVNPDAVIRRGSVSAMIAAAKGLPAPWIVGGKVFGIDGVEQRGARRLRLTYLRALRLAKWTLERDPPPNVPVRVGAISGAFFMMDRAHFQGLGGFDERYFLHVEDVDLCRRAEEAGGAVVYQPAAGALHYLSTSRAPSLFVERQKAKSLGLYFRTFARGPAARAFAWLMTPVFFAALVGRAWLKRLTGSGRP